MIKMGKKSGTREKGHIYCELKLTKTPESSSLGRDLTRPARVVNYATWHPLILFRTLRFLVRPRSPSWAVSTLVTYLRFIHTRPLARLPVPADVFAGAHRLITRLCSWTLTPMCCTIPLSSHPRITTCVLLPFIHPKAKSPDARLSGCAIRLWGRHI